METTLIEDLTYFVESHQLAREMLVMAANKFRIAARNCGHKCTKPASDWHTCTHMNNPTVIGICSIDHCPLRRST